jgi:hypothetical protein
MPWTLEDHIRRRRARAAAWRDRPGEADRVIAICEAWISDVLAQGYTLEHGHDWTSLPADLRLADRLSAAGLDALSLALTWQVEDRLGHEPDEAALIGHALAVAAGRAYALRGVQALPDIGGFISSISHFLWEDFADAAAETMRETPDALQAFGDFISDIVMQANTAPDSVIETARREPSFALLVERFDREGSLQDVWGAGRWPILFRGSGKFEILRRADPDRFIALIDQLPHPAMADQCLTSRALLSSPQDVPPLLRKTGLAFDSDGAWRRTGTTAIPLLQLAGQQLLAPGERVAEESELTEEMARFQEDMRELLEALFSRPDAFDLGWSWLENLLRQTPQGQAAPEGDRRCLRVNRLGLLIEALSRQLEPRGDQEAWVAAAEPLARQFRAVAVLCVAAYSAKAASLDVGSVARGLLKGEGFELTRATDFIVMAAAPVRVTPGHALAGMADAPTWFSTTWSSLRLERERSWRRRNANHTNPAQIMGLWGLGMIEALACTPQTDPEKVEAMWRAVEQAFREARLVEPRLGRDFWSQANARLFALWPQACVPKAAAGQNASPVDTASLGRALAPYAEVGGDFMAVIVSLDQAGISASELDQAVRHAGEDLLRIMTRFFETARGLDDRRAWNPAWVSALRALKDRIAVSRMTPLSGDA